MADTVKVLANPVTTNSRKITEVLERLERLENTTKTVVARLSLLDGVVNRVNRVNRVKRVKRALKPDVSPMSTSPNTPTATWWDTHPTFANTPPANSWDRHPTFPNTPTARSWNTPYLPFPNTSTVNAWGPYAGVSSHHVASRAVGQLPPEGHANAAEQGATLDGVAAAQLPQQQVRSGKRGEPPSSWFSMLKRPSRRQLP